MNTDVRGNGTMVMVMNILIVFLLMFVESLDDQNKYPNLLKPYNLHIQKMLCPKCEAWCANDPFFICGYSCQDIQHIEYDHKLGKRMLERDLSYVQFYAGNASFKPDLHFTSFENETILKEICDDKKTYNCTFTPFIYPLCTLDFKPYDDEMEDCCELLKKCKYNRNENIECEYYAFNGIEHFPRENPKYWTIHFFIQGGSRTKEFEVPWKPCNMQCTNGKLVRNNLSQTTPQTTLTPTTTPQTTEKTTFSTSIPTTKLTTPEIPILQTPTPNLTEKVDKTEALSQVIVGFLGINFVVVGAAIVAVIAELF